MVETHCDHGMSSAHHATYLLHSHVTLLQGSRFRRRQRYFPFERPWHTHVVRCARESGRSPNTICESNILQFAVWCSAHAFWKPMKTDGHSVVSLPTLRGVRCERAFVGFHSRCSISRLLLLSSAVLSNSRESRLVHLSDLQCSRNWRLSVCKVLAGRLASVD